VFFVVGNQIAAIFAAGDAQLAAQAQFMARVERQLCACLKADQIPPVALQQVRARAWGVQIFLLQIFSPNFSNPDFSPDFSAQDFSTPDFSTPDFSASDFSV
jgi:hypothetical protein